MSLVITPSALEVARRLKATCPTATHLMALLGEQVDEAFATGLLNRFGAEWLDLITSPSRATAAFGPVWRQIYSRDYPELIELMLAEHWFCREPALASRSLGDFIFDKSLHTIRSSIALSLFNRANELTWREPLTFVRALRIAERYLTGVVDNVALSHPDAAKEYEGRLGVALVLQGRYVDLDAATVDRMLHHLRRSIGHGNTSRDAIGFLAEALLRSHDSAGAAEPLLEITRLHGSTPADQRSSDLDLCTAEAWVRLSDMATSRSGRAEALRRASGLSQAHARSSEPLTFIRAAILHALIRSRATERASRLTLRGLRLPFGVAAQLRYWREVDPKATTELAGHILRALSAADRKLRDEPLVRRVIASVHSNLARADAPTSLTNAERMRHLESAIEIRSGGTFRRALSDPQSNLENALDLFELYRVKRTEAALVSAIRSILILAEFDQAWAIPLLILAREVDALPAPLSVQAALELRRGRRFSRELLVAVLERDADALFARAAHRALASRELDRKNIGGRSGVYLAEDLSGVVAETLVFKATRAVLAAREDERSTRIQERLNAIRRDRKFGVARTLAQTELPVDDVLRRHGAEVLVARQFHVGTLLAQAVSQADDVEKRRLLTDVVEYLAIIHATESKGATATVTDMRKDLWRREVGRWLRALSCADAKELFNSWFALFPPSLPPLARRDAHHLNWIVTARKQIIALDLEVCGWRPAGYELAQLLDDAPLLAVDDGGWKARAELTNGYAKHLRKHGIAVDSDALNKALEASTLARALCRLTFPGASRADRRHAEAMVDWLCTRGSDANLRAVAGRVRNAWAMRRGTTAATHRALADISDSRRRHLSRAMAYELRHGTEVPLSPGGWAPLQALVAALERSRIRTTPGELTVIASAIDEARFEVSDDGIRALYGHSRPVTIEYERVSAAPTLYHGTAFANINAIFSAGEGLRPMARHWVHLSSDPVAAQRTAERHGPGVLLAVDDPSCLEIYAAGGSVYLCKHVPPEHLRIETPAELFLSAV